MQDRKMEDHFAGLENAGPDRKLQDIQVAHPNFFSFLGHLQRATVDYMTDKRRLTNCLPIRRPRKKSRLLNETRLLSCTV